MPDVVHLSYDFLRMLLPDDCPDTTCYKSKFYCVRKEGPEEQLMNSDNLLSVIK